MDTQKFVSLDEIKVEYFIYGTGNKTIITLHGFGRDYSDFKFFDNELKGYKIIGINLFFHGKSYYPKHHISKNPISKELWFSAFEKILEQENVNQFNILSYSMGGKFAFCLLEKFSAKIEKAIFLAPDGIVINPWYKLMTYSKTGKFLSKSFGKTHFGIPQILKLTTALKVTKPTLKRFVEHNIGTQEKREKIYWVWQSFRKIIPDHKVICENLAINPIEIHVFLGKHDVAIKAGYKKKIKNIYGDRIKTHVLPVGHNLFKEIMKSYFQKIWQ